MNEFLIILGMSIVTLLPRWLPVFIVGKISFPKWLDQWLNYIPYAALGALIFPGILTVDPDHPSLGIIGGLAAILLAYFHSHIILIIFGSISAVMLTKILL
ncbi:MAG: AzlD domain-containing protein [Thermoactinomyces sp.]